MADINLNGNNDGVRMTWPRAAVLAIALIAAGGTWASVKLQLTSVQESQRETRAEVQALRSEVRELRDAYLLSTAPPPRIDAKGRILK